MSDYPDTLAPARRTPRARRRPADYITRIRTLGAAGDRDQRRSNLSFAIDAAMLAIAAGVSVASAPAAGLRTDIVALVIFCISVLAMLAFFGVYRPSFAQHFLDDARSILAATAIVAMAMTFSRVLIFDNPDAAAQAARVWLFASTYLLAARGGAYLVETSRRRAGEHGERTLIVGAGAVGRQFAERLIQRPEFGLHPVAFLDDDPIEIEGGPPIPIPILSSDIDALGSGALFGAGLEAAIEELSIGHVVVSFSAMSHQAELDLLRRCQRMGVTVSVLPRLFEGVTDRLDLERVGGIPLISVHPTDPRGWQYAIKYGGDRVLAAVAIVLLSPVLAGAGAATWLTLGRPVIFRQPRVGLDGREFDLFKFRTMRDPEPGEASEAELDDRFTQGLAPGGVEGTDRRTRVGTYLRRSSIDELPQLVNVLRGDMSLVGPRPERPSYASLFDESVYRYADRHRVKSGITGWSQVQGLRGNTSIADRVEWDNYYIENRSLWLDLKIAAMTIPALLRDYGKPRS